MQTQAVWLSTIMLACLSEGMPGLNNSLRLIKGLRERQPYRENEINVSEVFRSPTLPYAITEPELTASFEFILILAFLFL